MWLQPSVDITSRDRFSLTCDINRRMTQQGFLIISDITGYSKYVNESELEHARDSLTELLNILIRHTQSPLVISKLEGDAVFSYAPAGGFLQGQTLLDMIEKTASPSNLDITKGDCVWRINIF